MKLKNVLIVVKDIEKENSFIKTCLALKRFWIMKGI